MSDIIARVKAFLLNRKRAYIFTFDDKDESARAVLEDLKKFCRAESSTFDADPRIHALLEGRREVYLRIINHLQMNVDELFTHFGGKGE